MKTHHSRTYILLLAFYWFGANLCHGKANRSGLLRMIPNEFSEVENVVIFYGEGEVGRLLCPLIKEVLTRKISRRPGKKFRVHLK